MLKNSHLIALQKNIQHCTLCKKHLPFAPKPIYQASTNAKLLIIGQAPSVKVHESGLVWNDASGKRLIDWLGISFETLHDPNLITILPMGFCYPGKGAQGDLPPRKECAPLWHKQLLNHLNPQLILLIGSYAQKYYLPHEKRNLTELVRAWKEFLPLYIPLPHPSPINNRWLVKNKWFEKENVPALREIFKKYMHV